MRWSGILVLLYVGWHLADFTWGFAPFAPSGWVYGEIYDNFIASFSRVPVAVLYIVANLALGVHLFHGTWSLFQSMGWSSPRFNRWRRYLATGVATIVVVGNVSFPVAVLAGIAIKVGIDIIDWGFLRRAHRVSGRGATIMYGVIAMTVFVELITAVAIAHPGGLIEFADTTRLRMRALSPAERDALRHGGGRRIGTPPAPQKPPAQSNQGQRQGGVAEYRSRRVQARRLTPGESAKTCSKARCGWKATSRATRTRLSSSAMTGAC